MNNIERGKFLAQCRKSKKLTQEELGYMINYSRNNISKWETGESFPKDPQTITLLADIFEVSIEELMYGEKKNNDNEKLIIDNLISEYKNKYKKYKQAIFKIFLLIIVIFIISILFIYFVFIRGTISIYKISLDVDDFYMQDSVLLLSNDISTLHFNKLNSKDNNEEIKYIKLYYYENNEEKMLFSGENDDYFIEESNGYKEYCLEMLKKKELFLYIKTNNKEYNDIRLNVSRRYINNNIFPRKKDELGISQENIDLKNWSDKLIEDNFITEDNILFSKTLNSNVRIDIQEKNIRLIIVDKNNNNFETLESLTDSNQILYNKVENGKNIVNDIITFSDIKNCDITECTSINDYVAYINYYKKIMT